MTEWLLDTMVATGALIALVLVLRRPVAKLFGAKMAYALWALPLARLLLPPLVLPAWMAPVEETAPGSSEWTVAFEPAADVAPLAAAGVQAAPLADPVPWAAVAASVWFGGALAFLLWRAWSYRAMRRRLLDDAWPVGEAGNIRLVETPEATAPLAFGVFDKVVALPPAFMGQGDRTARDLAIAHELEHHSGNDLAANMAAQLVLALHWFNPLAWYGWRAMRRDQEAACDARVMAGREEAERARYALLIADFAAGSRFALAAPMACQILGEKSIIHRLRSLSMPEISTRRRLAGRTAMGAALLALPLTATISYAQVEEVDVPPSEADRSVTVEVDTDEDGNERRVFVIRRDGEGDASGEVEWNFEIDEEVRKAMEEARAEAGDAREEAREMRLVLRGAEREAAEAEREARNDAREMRVIMRQARREADEARAKAEREVREHRFAFVDRDDNAQSFMSGEGGKWHFDHEKFAEFMENFHGHEMEFKELREFFAEDGEFAAHMREIERQTEELRHMKFDCEDGEEARHDLPDGREIVIRCRQKVSMNVEFTAPVRMTLPQLRNPVVPTAIRASAVPAIAPVAEAGECPEKTKVKPVRTRTRSTAGLVRVS